MSDVSQFLADASFQSNPAFKFANIGDTIEGVIADTPRVVETDDLNGGRTEKLVVDIETADGTFAVWIKKGAIGRAVAEAVKAAGVDGLAKGGTLKLQYHADGTPPKAGFHPPKLFKARYTPPAAPTVSLEDF